jgi:hypothetical protein
VTRESGTTARALLTAAFVVVWPGLVAGLIAVIVGAQPDGPTAPGSLVVLIEAAALAVSAFASVWLIVRGGAAPAVWLAVPGWFLAFLAYLAVDLLQGSTLPPGFSSELALLFAAMTVPSFTAWIASRRAATARERRTSSAHLTSASS